MSRKHLFAIVVLLGAAAVAGLLALTRTGSVGAAATPASSTEITARTQTLDRLEASLERSLAEQPPAVPTRKGAAAQSAPSRTIFVRAPHARRAGVGSARGRARRGGARGRGRARGRR